jgi:hypothetical protein
LQEASILFEEIFIRQTLAQRLVHPIGGVAAHGKYPVRVAVEGHRDRGVAKQVLD